MTLLENIQLCILEAESEDDLDSRINIITNITNHFSSWKRIEFHELQEGGE